MCGKCDHATTADHFAGLGDDFDLESTLASPTQSRAPVKGPDPFDLVKKFEEPCTKCKGSGRFRSWAGRDVGPCLKCKGTGKLEFSQSAEKRAGNRAKSAARKVASADSNWAAFAESNADLAQWIDSNPGFEFAGAMREAVRNYATLTERQEIAIRKCMAREIERAEATAARIESAPVVSVLAIESAFAKAEGKAVALRVAGFKITRAKAGSTNEGALYVKAGAAYMGKFKEGRFFRSRECTDADEKAILAIAADPKGAAIAYGRETGTCSVCGRTLTDANSIAAGIGPICAANFGWS
jgi:hypothetical protein